MKENHTIVLSGNDVITITENFGLDNLMDLIIQNLTLAIEEYNTNFIDIPIRKGFNYNGKHPGLIEWMPVHQIGKEVTIKVVGYHPNNPNNYNLPTILSSISAYDTSTGHLRGIADGVFLTALRTGAASAVASRLMAKQDSTVLGLIGCGCQSIIQLHALSRVFDLQSVMIYDVDRSAMDSFLERIAPLNLNIQIIFSNIEKIIADADIVCTETSLEVGEGPLFENLDSKNHLHINAIGSDFPGKIELPLDLLQKSYVCPDFIGQAKIEGECQQLDDTEIGLDWVQLTKRKNEYLHLKDVRTVFDSTGWALEDYVMMDLFLNLAEKFSVGTAFNIENVSEDAKNPYHFLKEPKTKMASSDA